MNARRIPFAPAILLLVAGLASLVSSRAAAQPAGAATAYLGAGVRGNSEVLDAQNAFPGLTVTRVVENSPAEAAGLREGDVILSAAGVDLRDPNQLDALLAGSRPGDPFRLEVERDRERLSLEATLVARVRPSDPSAKPEEAPRLWIENERLGVEFGLPSPDAVRALGLTPGQGVVVTRLAEQSPLKKAGLPPGALIAEANARPILSPDAFLKQLESLDGAGRVRLRWFADGKPTEKTVAFHRPDRQTSNFRIPLLFSYERKANSTEFSIPLLLFRRKSYDGATEYRWLHFFRFESGEADELLEVEK